MNIDHTIRLTQADRLLMIESPFMLNEVLLRWTYFFSSSTMPWPIALPMP